MNQQTLKLGDYRLIPAPIDRFRRPPPQTHLRVPLRAASAVGASEPPSGGSPSVPLPAFWYDPPWHRCEPERCRLVADMVGRLGVTVAALQNELSHQEGELEGIDWSRLAPHRCDRAGWNVGDFQDAAVIELRLGMNRDRSGAYAYSAAQMARWNKTGEVAESTAPSESRSWSPLLFPPEWADLLQMRSKVAQLRALSDAAIYVSCDEAVLEEVLTAACAARADGVIVRFQDDPVSVLLRSSAILDASELALRPQIWVAGGAITPQDAVKCLALGAAAISVDSMCNAWLLGDDDEPLTNAERAAIKLGVNVGQTPEERLQSRIRKGLGSWTAQLSAVAQSLFVSDIGQLTAGHLQNGDR